MIQGFSFLWGFGIINLVMDTNLTQQMEMDSGEIRNMVSQVMSEALKAMPRPEVPSWLEGLGAYVRMHPWISLFIVLGIVLVVSAVIREILCSYFKTNEILARLKRLEERCK